MLEDIVGTIHSYTLRFIFQRFQLTSCAHIFREILSAHINNNGVSYTRYIRRCQVYAHPIIPPAHNFAYYSRGILLPRIYD